MNKRIEIIATVTVTPVAAALGVYKGPASTASTIPAVTAFGTWAGKPVQVATDYLWGDGWHTFDINHMQQYTTGPWGTWKAQDPTHRKLALGVPLLVDGYAGNFNYVTSGQADGWFWWLAQSLVNNGLVDTTVRLGWEPNNPASTETVSGAQNWNATTNVAGYKAAYRHVIQLMKLYTGQHFTYDWTTAIGFSGQCSSFDACYPGDDVTNSVGFDVYDLWYGQGVTSADARWTHIMNTPGGLASHRAFATAHGKPESFPEWGLFQSGNVWGGGGDNPAFINNMAAWMRTGNVSFQSYFDIDWAGSGTLEGTFPSGAAAYKTQFGA
jgi:hypothetical protein